MARTLTAAMQTALAADEGYADVWLLQLTSAGGTLRFTSAPEDQDWNSLTWTALGGRMEFEEAAETEDMTSQQVGVTLGGVDQAVVSEILGDDYRGQACVLYFGQIQHSTGLVVVDPIAVFTGLLNEPWTVHEQLPVHGAGSVVIRTTVVGEVGTYTWHSPVRTNLQSHQDMLDRAGLGVVDKFFDKVPDITNRVIKWGSGFTGGRAGGKRDGGFDKRRREFSGG